MQIKIEHFLESGEKNTVRPDIKEVGNFVFARADMNKGHWRRTRRIISIREFPKELHTDFIASNYIVNLQKKRADEMEFNLRNFFPRIK